MVSREQKLFGQSFAPPILTSSNNVLISRYAGDERCAALDSKARSTLLVEDVRSLGVSGGTFMIAELLLFVSIHTIFYATTETTKISSSSEPIPPREAHLTMN
jgi:hypothetical protein